MSEREAFEAWVKAPPYEKIVTTIAGDRMWPGQYVSYEVQLAWEAWQAGGAALAARLRDAEARLVRAENLLSTFRDHAFIPELLERDVEEIDAFLAARASEARDA